MQSFPSCQPLIHDLNKRLSWSLNFGIEVGNFNQERVSSEVILGFQKRETYVSPFLEKGDFINLEGE